MEQILTFLYEYKELLLILTLSVFLGVELISKVPSVLHTPLMSGANAISGVVLIGAVILLGHADSLSGKILGFLALALGTFNVVGGFAVTDRMLNMFKKKKKNS